MAESIMTGNQRPPALILQVALIRTKLPEFETEVLRGLGMICLANHVMKFSCDQIVLA